MKLWTDNSKCGNSDLKKQSVSLLSQQIWCWGRDIEYSNDNLLLRYGFHRVEKQAGSKANSIYRLELTPTSRVILRGFGVFYGDDSLGGLFLPRFEFCPKLTPASELPRPAWNAQDLPPLTDPIGEEVSGCQQLLLELIDWIYQYEVWIAETFGVEYRRKTLSSYIPNKCNIIIPAEEMANTWRLLAESTTNVTVTNTYF